MTTTSSAPNGRGALANRAARRAARREGTSPLPGIPSAPQRSSRPPARPPTSVQPRRTGVRGNR